MKVEKRVSRLWTYRAYYPLGHGPNDFFCIGQTTDDIRGLCEKYYKKVLKQRTKWDEIRLINLEPNSRIVDEFSKIITSPFIRKVETRTDRNYFIDTTQDYEHYYDSFLRRSLRDVRGRINRIEKAGRSYSVVQSGVIERSELEEILRIYFDRRAKKGQSNSFLNDSHFKMLLEVMDIYARKGWVLYSKMIGDDNKIWAYQLDFFKDGIHYHYLPTFDPAYAEFSPGKVLLFETVKRAFQLEDVKEFNFMRGESGYKTQYTTHYQYYTNLLLENRLSWNYWATKIRSSIKKLIA